MALFVMVAGAGGVLRSGNDFDLVLATTVSTFILALDDGLYKVTDWGPDLLSSDSPTPRKDCPYSDDGRALSDAMMDYWGSFARHGRPHRSCTPSLSWRASRRSLVPQPSRASRVCTSLARRLRLH